VACGGPAQLRYEEQLENTPASADHAVHDQRLSELMESLDRLRNERLPKAMDVAIEEERETRAVARVARAMADSATRIPAAAPADLDERERAEFLALAREFQQRTERLAETRTPPLTRELRRERLDAIDMTCHECHRNFRIPGPDDVDP
jgi:hypothetical protein